MEIVKPGKLPDEHVYGKCPYCRAELKAKRDELVEQWCPREQYCSYRGQCPTPRCGRTVHFYG